MLLSRLLHTSAIYTRLHQSNVKDLQAKFIFYGAETGGSFDGKWLLMSMDICNAFIAEAEMPHMPIITKTPFKQEHNYSTFQRTGIE